MPELSSDTQAILLLCGTFGAGNRGVKPLTLGEYNKVASWLMCKGLRPADILAPTNGEMEGLSIDPTRLKALLDRGTALAVSLERWEQIGIWVVGRGDAAYPAQLKRRLGSRAPAYLYGVGVRALLSQAGLAVVGSRDADTETLDFVSDVARRCAAEDVPIVSGGARGVDERAMLESLAAKGASVGVLSHGLAQAALARKYRSALRDGRLALVSKSHPDAGFHAGAAMERNKYIYCLARAALVAKSGTSGGTWTGATECMRAGWVPVFVRPLHDEQAGNTELLKRAGAHPWPGETEIGALLERYETRSQRQLGLFATQAWEPVAPFTPSSMPDSEPTRDEMTVEPPVTGDTFYELFLRFLRQYLGAPKREKEIVEALGLKQGQVRDWLKRALEDGQLTKSKKGLYSLAEPGND